MKIPRFSMITLGVADLARSTRFYAQVMATAPNTAFDGVTFIELPGVWLGLYPLDKLAEDIAPNLRPRHGGFGGFSLAHNTRSREDVVAVVERARAAGARVVKEPQEAFWGGFHAYFADPDEHYWEIAWGPMFEFTDDGSMRFRKPD